MKQMIYRKSQIVLQEKV